MSAEFWSLTTPAPLTATVLFGKGIAHRAQMTAWCRKVAATAPVWTPVRDKRLLLKFSGQHWVWIVVATDSKLTRSAMLLQR